MDQDDPFKDMSPRQFLEWLERQPPEFRMDIQQILLGRGPDAQIAAIRSLRAIAVDPHVSDKDRDHAKWVLAKTGFDDESLREEKD